MQAVDNVQKLHPDVLHDSGSLTLVRSNLRDLHTELNTTLGARPSTPNSAPMNHPNALEIRQAPVRFEAESETGKPASLPV
jgi:hypothetical protein